MIPSNGKSSINCCYLLRVGLIRISLISLAHSFPVKEALDDLMPSIIPITARAPPETLLIQSKRVSTCGSSKPTPSTFPTTQAPWDSAKDTSKSSSDTAGAWTSKTSLKASGNSLEGKFQRKEDRS
ncbi:hypothetical protein BDR06DRAFT_1015131 [Suillus hirtellus]|nr:hypothetical protein BDR06DRAFT_1015131 [Suillus hirtellus]